MKNADPDLRRVLSNQHHTHDMPSQSWNKIHTTGKEACENHALNKKLSEKGLVLFESESENCLSPTDSELESV